MVDRTLRSANLSDLDVLEQAYKLKSRKPLNAISRPFPDRNCCVSADKGENVRVLLWFPWSLFRSPSLRVDSGGRTEQLHCRLRVISSKTSFARSCEQNSRQKRKSGLHGTRGADVCRGCSNSNVKAAGWLLYVRNATMLIDKIAKHNSSFILLVRSSVSYELQNLFSTFGVVRNNFFREDIYSVKQSHRRFLYGTLISVRLPFSWTFVFQPILFHFITAFSSQEAALPLVSIRNRDLWADFLNMRRVFFSFRFNQSGLSDLTESLWISNFQCRTGQEVAILPANQKERGLWAGENNNWSLRTEKKEKKLSTRSQVNKCHVWLVSFPLRRLYITLIECFVYRNFLIPRPGYSLGQNPAGVNKLALIKQPKNSLQLSRPTSNIYKIANKLMTIVCSEINLQSKHDLICQAAKVKAITMT